MELKKINLSFFVLLLGAISSCGVYSFTGASIPPYVKTISIQPFYNNAPLGPSNMSTLFTEKIRDYFIQNTNLEFANNDGNLQLDGYISNYTITPVAANTGGQGQGDFSALSRITITVAVTYVNPSDHTFDFDRNFSFFKDFDNQIDLASNEEQFIEEIFSQIILDIFNASVVNW